MAKQDDSLFLLEVLVDKIRFKKSPCFADKEFKTCVTIKCSAMPPLEIWDDNSCPQTGGPFVASFNSGKSCLFPLKQSEIDAAKSMFTVDVSVFKALPCSCLPTEISLGKASIDMTKEFVQAVQKYTADPNCVSFEALKDSFVLSDGSGDVGEITMFLRISCFGNQIITRFQGGAGPPNLGGGMGSQSAVTNRSCNEPRGMQSVKEPCGCSMGPGSAGGGRSNAAPCSMHGASGAYGAVCPPARDPYNSMPCADPDDPCYCTGPKPLAKQQMACRNTDQYCLHIPKGRSKQFEEIGTNLGGNELKIKVPASASIIKKISQTHCAMQCPYVKGGKDGGPCVPPCGKNQISLALPSEATCCRGAQLADTQFTCTTEGCTQVSKHGQQAAMMRGTGDRQELPNKDVFVLKVAKTALQGDRKCRMELELVTPKGPDKDLPVEKVNTRIQSDLDYCCPTGNKVIFQMPQDVCGMNHKQRAHFNFRSDGVGDMSRDDPAQLMPTTAEAYSGVVYDFPKQVIKLRIGKTVEMPGRKSKFEYQFITPVVNYEKVVPVTDTRTSQCVPCCRDGMCGRCCRPC